MQPLLSASACNKADVKGTKDGWMDAVEVARLPGSSAPNGSVGWESQKPRIWTRQGRIFGAELPVLRSDRSLQRQNIPMAMYDDPTRTTLCGLSALGGSGSDINVTDSAYYLKTKRHYRVCRDASTGGNAHTRAWNSSNPCARQSVGRRTSRVTVQGDTQISSERPILIFQGKGPSIHWRTLSFRSWSGWCHSHILPLCQYGNRADVLLHECIAIAKAGCMRRQSYDEEP